MKKERERDNSLSTILVSGPRDSVSDIDSLYHRISKVERQRMFELLCVMMKLIPSPFSDAFHR